MAELLLRRELEIRDMPLPRVSSAGIFPGGKAPLALGALKIAVSERVEFPPHVGRPLTDDLIQSDLILAMTGDQLEDVGIRYPSAMGRTHLLMKYVFRDNVDILDPATTNVSYEETIETLKLATKALANTFFNAYAIL